MNSGLRADLAAALARGVEAQSSLTPQVALRSLDPLLALVAKRRLRRLLARVQRVTIEDDPAHRLRVASLLLADPKRELDFDDHGVVEAAYRALGPLPGPRRSGPWFTLGTLVTLAALSTAIVFIGRALRPFDPQATDAGRVLGENLASFVVRTDNGQSGSALDEARAALSGKVAQRALGDDTVTAIGELLGATTAVVQGGQTETGRPSIDRFYNAANSLAARLRKRQLPYFVDADVLIRDGRSFPLLMSFYIERESEFQSGKLSVRAIDLWRLDTIRVRFGALGYTRPRTPAALVLLDQVESELVRTVLPALAPGEPAELVDDETRERKLPWVGAVERAAGEAVRKHYSASSADPHVLEVGKLLARRRALVRAWRATVADGGHRFHVPERLIPEADYSSDLHLRVASSELYEWDDLHGELMSKPNYAAFLRLREPYVLGIERHEVQHRLDFAHDFRAIPQILCRIMGIQDALDAPLGSRQERVSSEFSAYLAQAVEGPDSPDLLFVVLSSVLLNADLADGVYWYAALGLLESVATELGIDAERVVGHGRLERERVATLLTQVIARSPADLRAAAARAYEKAFGEPVPHVVKKSLSEHPAWRH